MKTDQKEKKEQTNMRLPVILKEKIKKSAKENRRSLSAEVIYILEQFFLKHK